MRKGWTGVSTLGIENAEGFPMKALRPAIRACPDKHRKKAAKATKRPLKISVVFDEPETARSVEILIRNVASDHECAVQFFRFEELDAPAAGVLAARKAADTDIVILAARGDRELPAHVRLWLGLCMGLRDQDREGALVAMITQVEGADDLHSSMMEYLETVAIINGLAFLPQQSDVPIAARTVPAPPGLNAYRRIHGLTGGRVTQEIASSRSGIGPLE
jgi:hypothetical protein